MTEFEVYTQCQVCHAIVPGLIKGPRLCPACQPPGHTTEYLIHPDEARTHLPDPHTAAPLRHDRDHPSTPPPTEHHHDRPEQPTLL